MKHSIKGYKHGNVIRLNKMDEYDMEALAASDIFRVLEENDVPLTPRYKELMDLLQVPEFARSLFAHMTVLKRVYHLEIKDYYKEE
jgi:hypothetical protein